MFLDVSPLALQSTVTLTVYLFLKFFATLVVQGGKRFAGGSRPPEDAVLGAGMTKGVKQTYGIGQGAGAAPGTVDAGTSAAGESSGNVIGGGTSDGTFVLVNDLFD